LSRILRSALDKAAGIDAKKKPVRLADIFRLSGFPAIRALAVFAWQRDTPVYATADIWRP